MNKLQGYLFGCSLLFALGLSLNSCSKEVNAKAQDTCDCIEQHEEFKVWSVNGVMQSGYVLEYETPAEEKSCELDNGVYIQKSNSTRYKIVCY